MIHPPIGQAEILRRRANGCCAPATTTSESSKRNSKLNRSSAIGPTLPGNQEIKIALVKVTMNGFNRR